jgi:tetratricopeptide (TPR) repeat protein
MNRLLPALLTLVLPMSAQALPERFKENRVAWEEGLEKGHSAPVRKATEALLQMEGAAVNPSDYNAMHAMVAVMNLAARACVQEGAWEDAVAHLQKATQAATDNETAAEATFGRIVKQHQDKLQEWREESTKQEQRLQALETQGGLTFEQIKLKGQIRSFLDEYRNAIAQSEKALAEINGLLALLHKEKEAYAASLAEWQGFIAKERAELARASSPAAYVVEKLDQIKADDARPRVERLAYGRRLQRLDSANADVNRFVGGLMGKEDAAPVPLPKAMPKKSRRAKG